MASKIEPRINQDGEPIKWEPSQIPSTKPFVNIVTSAYEEMTTLENMRFIKTRSLIYTPFHKEARYVNFEIGYSKESRWLEFINDKWSSFANFFVAGFFEGIYDAYEKGLPVTYVQVEAKVIDYDARFRSTSSPSNLTSTPTASPSANIFAQKRNKISSSHSPHTPRNNSLQEEANVDVTIMENMQEEENDTNEEKDDDDKSTTPHKSKKKQKLSDLCNSDSDEPNEPTKKNQSSSGKSSRGGCGRQRGGRKGPEKKK